MNSSTHFPIHFHVLENVSWSARFLHQLLQWNHPLIQWWYIHFVSGRPIQKLGGGKILPLTVHFYDPIHKLWNRLKLQQLQDKRHYIICFSIVNRVSKQNYQRRHHLVITKSVANKAALFSDNPPLVDTTGYTRITYSDFFINVLFST